MAKTLPEISEAMRDIDFCTLSARAADGSIGARPMSNNREVAYSGDSWFFTYQDARMVEDIAREGKVGLAYQGKAGLIGGVIGKPGIFIAVESDAELVRDKAQFAAHWVKSLDRWFPQGIDTPGLVMIRARARRIHYWDGEEEAEVHLAALTES
ncbi:MAG: pyridoxamine 5-phosphate oxidase [Novosphingobium sp.]|nr:pyridoxamine 5-phosphate oxidase [Novosphingobium sp.]